MGAIEDLVEVEAIKDLRHLYCHYDDVYKKAAGRWRIHRTRIDFLWPRREYHGPREM
jgi:hypothetical protein